MEQIINILKQLTELGINPFIIIAVVFLTTIIKSFDKKNKFKQGYVLIPLFTSLAICLLTQIQSFVFSTWIIDSCSYAAIGAYGYNIYYKLLKGKKE